MTYTLSKNEKEKKESRERERERIKTMADFQSSGACLWITLCDLSIKRENERLKESKKERTMKVNRKKVRKREKWK